MIRFFVGIIITFGAAGGVEVDNATLLEGVLLACVGIALMAWPVIDGTIVDGELKK